MKDVNVQKDRVDPSKGQNCFWQKLSKVCASTTGLFNSLFLNISEIVLHYLFRHLFRQLTRSRKEDAIIIQIVLQNLLPLLKKSIVCVHLDFQNWQ